MSIVDVCYGNLLWQESKPANLNLRDAYARQVRGLLFGSIFSCSNVWRVVEWTKGSLVPNTRKLKKEHRLEEFGNSSMTVTWAEK
jgi:hypothetical protein